MRGCVLTAALVVLAALVTACSHPPAAHGAASMRLADCGGTPQTRPHVVVVTCTSTDITAHDLTWAGWGGKVATATGYAVVNVCAYNDCHTGSYASVPIVLAASGTATCPGGQHGYARIQYMFVGRSPFQGLPANMKVPAAWWGPAGVGSTVQPRPCH